MQLHDNDLMQHFEIPQHVRQLLGLFLGFSKHSSSSSSAIAYLVDNH
uniref:Uncharacterized protein n=1 Tax=Rhizophora mucronata TaxID=61149 RepID=A0A2P2QQA3_RHIMU